jgi:RNA polymerase sigma-70 factor (ECF subfamily)
MAHDTVEIRPGEKDRFEQFDDVELVARVNRGDEAAFAALYHRHKDWVAGLAYRWTGDRETALDVLQETFLYFAKKFPGFRLTAKLQTFLYPAVRNLSIAARRKAGRYESLEPDAPVMEEQAVDGPVAGEGEQMQAALASLPETHREVLLLRFVDGLELAEIAEAMEIPLGTVKSRMHNALETLRQDARTKQLFEE